MGNVIIEERSHTYVTPCHAPLGANIAMNRLCEQHHAVQLNLRNTRAAALDMATQADRLTPNACLL